MEDIYVGPFDDATLVGVLRELRPCVKGGRSGIILPPQKGLGFVVCEDEEQRIRVRLHDWQYDALECEEWC